MTSARLSVIAATAIVLGAACGYRAAAAAAVPGVWTTEIGGFGSLERAVVFADDDVWAVGDGIVHYDGVEWRQTAGFEYPAFHGIDGLSAEELWVVGEVETDDCETYGFVLRRDGDAWREETLDTHQPLYDVDMLSTTDGWAVGGIEVPVILHYDGTRWTAVGAPETGGLRSVHMIDARTGWAVGVDGAIVRYDGTFWIEAPSPTHATLLDVRFYDRDVGWAVGMSDAYAESGTILAYADGEWDVDVNRRVPVLTAVHPLGRGQALAVGVSGVLVRFDGDDWREIGRTYPGGYTTDSVGAEGAAVTTVVADTDTVAGSSSPLADATARGHRAASPSPAGASSRTADTVRPSGGGGAYYGAALRDVVLLPQSEALLAVGDAGQIIHVQGGDWSEIHSGRTFAAIDMLSSTEGWVVGPDGPPLHFDGVSWSPVPVPRRAAWLQDVVTLAPDDAWAVGETGAIVHWNGGTWSLSPRVTREDLYRVAFGAPDDGWTYANVFNHEDGTQESFVFHFDGTAWHEEIHLCHESLTDIAALSPSDVWFAAYDQEVLHFDGAGWTWIPILGAVKDDDYGATVHHLAAVPGGIWGIGYDNAWYDGVHWRSLPDDTTDDYLSAAAAVSADGFWAVEEFWSASRSGTRLLTFDRAGVGGVAHAQRAALWDIDLVRLPDDNVEAWAVGEGATVVRYRTSAPGVRLPEPTATPLVASPEPYATPTPRSSLDGEDIHATLLAEFDPEDTGEAAVGAPELVTWGEAERRIAAFENGRYVYIGGSGGYYETCYGWRPVWFGEVTGSPHCWEWDGDPEDGEMRPSHVLVALDAASGVETARWCYLQRAEPAYLPLLLGGRPLEDIPTPEYPTPEPRNITPRPVENVDGPCPTVTPYPYAYP